MKIIQSYQLCAVLDFTFLYTRASGIVLSVLLCLSVHPSVLSSVRSQLKILEVTDHFLIFFSMKLESHTVGKSPSPFFFKKNPDGSRGPKKPQKCPQHKVRNFDKYLTYLFICTFLLEYESSAVFLTFYKNHMSAKNLALNPLMLGVY